MGTGYLIIGIVLLALGLLGCFMPIIPGPPLVYAAMLLRYFTDHSEAPAHVYSTALLVIMGVFMVLVTVLDYVIPAWIMRKGGGSKSGSRGAFIGMVAGIFFTPIGMLLGMFLGAFMGEMMHNKDNVPRALSMALLSFVGFLLSTGLKVIYCMMIVWYFFFP